MGAPGPKLKLDMERWNECKDSDPDLWQTEPVATAVNSWPASGTRIWICDAGRKYETGKFIE